MLDTIYNFIFNYPAIFIALIIFIGACLIIVQLFRIRGTLEKIHDALAVYMPKDENIHGYYKDIRGLIKDIKDIKVAE